MSIESGQLKFTILVIYRSFSMPHLWMLEVKKIMIIFVCIFCIEKLNLLNGINHVVANFFISLYLKDVNVLDLKMVKRKVGT